MSNGNPNSFGEEFTNGRCDSPHDLVLEPPITVLPDDADERADRLANLVADKVIPRLLGIYSAVADAPQKIVCPQDDEISELARLVVGPENADAADYILKLKDSGCFTR